MFPRFFEDWLLSIFVDLCKKIQLYDQITTHTRMGGPPCSHAYNIHTTTYL